jgi:Uroporphyrinogen-III decarboxylase
MKYDYYINYAQVKESHERLIKAYNMEKVDHVPVVEMTNGPLGYSIYELAYDEDKMLRQQLNNISLTMRHKTDYCPFLEPWHCVPIYAEPFGAEIIWFEDDWPAAKPIIYDNPMDVYKLKPRKVWESDLWKKLRKTIEHFQKCTKDDLPIATTDPQGPMANATLLWKTDEFFVACYTNPKEVHYIMNLLTEQFMEYYDAQLKIIDNPAFPGHSFPLGQTGLGISISDDNAVMLSPELYEEFCLPYYSKIAEHYNGLYLHCCGNFMHNLESILKIPKLKAINYHSSPKDMDPIKARGTINGRCAVWTAVSQPEIGFNGNRPPLEELYKDYYVPGNLKSSDKGIILSGFGTYYGTQNISPEEQDDRYDWTVGLMKNI